MMVNSLYMVMVMVLIIISLVKVSGIFIDDLVEISRQLIFWLEVFIFDMVEFMKVSVMVIFSEVKKYGIECGRLILSRMFMWCVFSMCKMFFSLGFSVVRLVVMLIMMGKKEIRNVVRMVGFVLMLNQIISIGMKVVLGKVLKVVMSGQVVVYSMGEDLIMKFSVILIVMVMVKFIMVI